MTSRKYLRYAIQIFLVLFAVSLVIAGQPLTSTFRTASRLSAGVPIAILIVETWIWHWRILQRWSWFPVPDLRGTWKGTLVSNYQRLDGSPVPPIETYMVIRQSLLGISVRQFTFESSSELLSGGICSDKDGVKHINGIFLNTPNMSVLERSPIAYGAFIYRVEGHPTDALSGRYWTDRKTGGDARFSERVPKTCHSFKDAHAVFGGVSPADVQTAAAVAAEEVV